MPLWFLETAPKGAGLSFKESKSTGSPNMFYYCLLPLLCMPAKGLRGVKVDEQMGQSCAGLDMIKED